MKSFVHNRHVFFVCLISLFGFGIFSAANISAKSLSTSAWIAPAVCAIVFTFPALILSRLSSKYENSNIYEYSTLAAGRIGVALSFVFSLFYLLFCALMLSYYAHIISMWILPNTSFRFICAFIAVICFYALSCGFTSVTRLISMIGFLALCAVIIVRIVMIFSGDMTNLLPAIDTETLNEGFGDAFWGCLPFFFGVGTLAVIPRPKGVKSSFAGSLVAIISAGALLILVTAACMAMIGPLQTGMYEDAMVLAMKAFDISYVTFIQRADIIFIITWSLLILSSICCIIYVPYLHAEILFSKKKNTLVRFCMCLLIFIIANIPSDMTHALSLITSLCKYAGIFVIFIIPLIILIFPEVRRHAKK